MPAPRRPAPDTHDPIHVILYGDSGAGKSTAAATFPKPMRVFLFDNLGKETPYLRRGVAQPWDGTTRRVLGKKGRPIIEIEAYHNADPKAPTGYPHFLQRLTEYHPEATGDRTVVFDSVTFMELAARKWAQYILNPGGKEPRQWFASATDALEELLMIRAGGWPVNVVVVCHVDEQADELHGTIVRSPKAPGRLRKGLAAGYGELYHAVVTTHEGTGLPQYLWQTRSDAMWSAASQVEAPNPCLPEYAAIWTGTPPVVAAPSPPA